MRYQLHHYLRSYIPGICAHLLNGSNNHICFNLSDLEDYWSYATELIKPTMFSVPWCLSSFVHMIFRAELAGILPASLECEQSKTKKFFWKCRRRQCCCLPWRVWKECWTQGVFFFSWWLSYSVVTQTFTCYNGTSLEPLVVLCAILSQLLM